MKGEKKLLSKKEFHSYTMGCFYQDELREHDEILRNLLDKQKEEIKEKIEKDLNDGKFYKICSNETTLKDYILKELNK